MGSIKKRVEALAEIYESERFYIKDIMTWKQLLTSITSDFTDEKKKKLATIEIILEDLKNIECTNKILFILLYDKIIAYLEISDGVEEERKIIVEFSEKVINRSVLSMDETLDNLADKNISFNGKEAENILVSHKSNAISDNRVSKNRLNDNDIRLSDNATDKYLDKSENCREFIKKLNQSRSTQFSSDNNKNNKSSLLYDLESRSSSIGRSIASEHSCERKLGEAEKISSSLKKSNNFLTMSSLVTPRILEAIQDVFPVAFNFNFPLDLKNQGQVGLEFAEPFYFLINSFYSYLLYLQNLPRAEYEFEKQMSLNPKLKDFINNFLIKKNLYDLGLKNLLFRPSMKIVRYSGLLKAVVKNHTDPEITKTYKDLIDNLNYISKILDNEIKKRADMFNIYSLYNRFNFSKLKNKYALGLIYENTRLLKEGKIIVKLSDSDPASYKNIYIFNRFILICQTFNNHFESIQIDDDPIFLSKLYLLKNLEGYKTDINLQSMVPLYLIQKANKKVVALYFEDENSRNVYFSIINLAISKVRQKMDKKIKIHEMKVLDGEVNSLILSKNSFGSFLREPIDSSLKTISFSEEDTDELMEDNSSTCSYETGIALDGIDSTNDKSLSASEKTLPDISKEFHISTSQELLKIERPKNFNSERLEVSSNGIKNATSAKEDCLNKDPQVFVLDEKSKKYYFTNDAETSSHHSSELKCSVFRESQLNLVHNDFSSASVDKISNEFSFEARPSLKTSIKKFLDKKSKASYGDQYNVNKSSAKDFKTEDGENIHEVVRLDQQELQLDTIEIEKRHLSEEVKSSLEFADNSLSSSNNKFDFSNFGRVASDDSVSKPELKDLKYKDIFTPDVEILSRDAFYIQSENMNFSGQASRGFCYDLFKKNTLPWSVIEIENDLNPENIQHNEKMVIFSNSDGIFKIYQGKKSKIYSHSASKIIYDPEYEIILMLCENYVHMAKLNYKIDSLDAQIINTEVNDFFCGKTKNIAYIALVAVEEFSFNVIHLLTLRYSNKEKRLKFSVIRKLYVGFKINNIFFLKGRIIISCKDFEIIEIDTLRTQELLEAYDTTLSLLLEFKDYFMANSIFRLEKNSLLLCFDGGGYLIDSKGQFKKENVCYGWETIGHTFKIYDKWIIVLSEFYVSVFEICTGSLVLCEYYPGVKLAEGYNFPVFYNRRSVFVIDFTGKELKAIEQLEVFELTSAQTDSLDRNIGSDYRGDELSREHSNLSVKKQKDPSKNVTDIDLLYLSTDSDQDSPFNRNYGDYERYQGNHGTKPNDNITTNQRSVGVNKIKFDENCLWDSITVEYSDSSEGSDDSSFYIYHSQNSLSSEKERSHMKTDDLTVNKKQLPKNWLYNKSKNESLRPNISSEKHYSNENSLMSGEGSCYYSKTDIKEKRSVVDLRNQKYVSHTSEHNDTDHEKDKFSKLGNKIQKQDKSDSLSLLKPKGSSENSKEQSKAESDLPASKSAIKICSQDLQPNYRQKDGVFRRKPRPVFTRIGQVLNPSSEQSSTSELTSKDASCKNLNLIHDQSLSKKNFRSIANLDIEKTGLYIGPPSLDLNKIRKYKSKIKRRSDKVKSYNISVYDIILEYVDC